jgi:hypothetical protein
MMITIVLPHIDRVGPDSKIEMQSRRQDLVAATDDNNDWCGIAYLEGLSTAADGGMKARPLPSTINPMV